MDEKEKKGFGYKFANVIWYHHKWKLLLAVFLVVLVALFISEFSRREEYDLHVAVLADGEFSTSHAEFERFIADVVGDVNGDGKVLINIQYLAMQDKEWGEANQARVMTLFTEEDYMLYLCDLTYAEMYINLEFFSDPLENYGITSDGDSLYRVYVGDSAAIGSSPELASIGLYACLIDYTTVDRGDPDTLDAAVRVIKALLGNRA